MDVSNGDLIIIQSYSVVLRGREEKTLIFGSVFNCHQFSRDKYESEVGIEYFGFVDEQNDSENCV